jgi:hypothetical protein
MSSWWLKNMLKVSTLIFRTDIAEDRLLGPYFFHHVWLWLFTTISYETSLHSCCKRWICRLAFIYGPCMMALQHIFNLQSGNSWLTYFRNSGQDEVDQQHGLLVPSFKHRKFLFLLTSEVCCLCYRSKWYPGLATTSTQWTSDDSYDSWNFPASEIVTNLDFRLPPRCWWNMSSFG